MQGRIVWLDDDTDVIGVFVQPLKRAGYEVVALHSVNDALAHPEVIRQADLLLLDVLLPGSLDGKPQDTDQFYTGKALLKKVRQANGIITPFIVLSIVQKERIEEGLKETPPVAIISKLSNTPKDLKDAVDAFFRERDQRAETTRR